MPASAMGARLQPSLGEQSKHPYHEWIEEYVGEEFTAASRAATEQLDSLAGGLTKQRLDELTEIFRTASRLEADFWQQALDSAG